jgi:hypothetical protein
MLIILFLKYKSVNSSLVSVFFRDGAFYFVCLGGKHFRKLSMLVPTHPPSFNMALAIATANLIVNVASAVS